MKTAFKPIALFISFLTVVAIILSTAPRAATAQGSCAALPAGLVSWWPGDGNANDVVGSNNGTLQGGVSFAPGKVGQAFSFDGVSGVVLAPATGLPEGAASRTVAFWAKIDPSNDTSTGFGYGSLSTGQGFYIFPSHGENSGLLTFTPVGGPDIFAITDLRDGAYHLVAATYDGTTVKLYSDATPVASGDMILDTDLSGGASIGGAPDFSQLLMGQVDEVGVWNRVLTTSEIQAIYDAGSAGMCKNGEPTATTGPTSAPTPTPTTHPLQGSAFFATTRHESYSPNQVFRFDVAGPNDSATLDRTITSPEFNSILGAAFGPNGEMYVTNVSPSYQAGSIARILDPLGASIPNGLITNPSFTSPAFIVVRNSLMYVAQHEGNVLVFSINPDGSANLINTISDQQSAGTTRGVAINPSGTQLFVTQCCGEDQILRYTLDGIGGATFLDRITGNGLSNPHDMAFSPWGELFVTDAGSDSVSRFTFDQNGNPVAHGQITGNGLNVPTGLDFSPWGELFVGSHYAPLISRWTFNNDNDRTAVANGHFPAPYDLADITFYPSAATGNTPAGVNVVVSLGGNTSASFANVSSAGNTSVNTGGSGPSVPSGFNIGDQPTFYEISTTASYIAPVTVCLPYDATQYSALNPARLLHYENNAWADMTTSNDTTNHIVCAQVNSLSPFVVAKKTFTFLGFAPPVDNPPTINVAKAGQAIPIKWSLKDANGNVVGNLASVVSYGYGSLSTCSGTTDAIDQYVDAGSSSLRYDSGANQFILTSKTQSAWAGSCKMFTLVLSDGTKHKAKFQFKK